MMILLSIDFSFSNNCSSVYSTVCATDFLIVLSNTKVMTNAARILIPISPTSDSNTPDNNTPIVAEGTAAMRPHFATRLSA